jgi:hypothetical protein
MFFPPRAAEVPRLVAPSADFPWSKKSLRATASSFSAPWKRHLGLIRPFGKGFTHSDFALEKRPERPNTNARLFLGWGFGRLASAGSPRGGEQLNEHYRAIACNLTLGGMLASPEIKKKSSVKTLVD